MKESEESRDPFTNEPTYVDAFNVADALTVVALERHREVVEAIDMMKMFIDICQQANTPEDPLQSVYILNDDVHSLEGVIKDIQAISGCKAPVAKKIAEEANQWGKALLDLVPLSMAAKYEEVMAKAQYKLEIKPFLAKS